MMPIYSYPYNDEDYNPSMPMVEIEILPNRKSTNQIPVLAIIDTGSDATLIPAWILHKLEATYVREGFLRGVSGVREAVKLYNVSIRLGTQIISGVTAVGSLHNGEVLLGRDVLNQLVITLNGLANMTEIQE